jgi:hypothetical protein
MFWYIVAFIGGVLFTVFVITCYLLNMVAKSFEEAHKDGYDNPYL